MNWNDGCHYNMSHKKGYSPHRFTETPHKDIYCVFCSCIVKNPVECQICGTLICVYCQAMNSQCLHCKSMQPFRKPSRVLLDIIGNLLLKCRFEGCHCIQRLKDIRSHEKRCQHRTIKCKSSICKHRRKEKEMLEEDSGMLVCDSVCSKVFRMEGLLNSNKKHQSIELFKDALRSSR